MRTSSRRIRRRPPTTSAPRPERSGTASSSFAAAFSRCLLMVSPSRLAESDRCGGQIEVGPKLLDRLTLYEPVSDDLDD